MTTETNPGREPRRSLVTTALESGLAAPRRGALELAVRPRIREIGHVEQQHLENRTPRGFLEVALGLECTLLVASADVDLLRFGQQ